MNYAQYFHLFLGKPVARTSATSGRRRSSRSPDLPASAASPAPPPARNGALRLHILLINLVASSSADVSAPYQVQLPSAPVDDTATSASASGLFCSASPATSTFYRHARPRQQRSRRGKRRSKRRRRQSSLLPARAILSAAAAARGFFRQPQRGRDITTEAFASKDGIPLPSQSRRPLASQEGQVPLIAETENEVHQQRGGSLN